MRQDDLLRKSKILIVDDEPAIVCFFTQMLKRAGYVNVFGLTDPLAAVGLYRELRPDLVLLDIHMPDLDGMELIEMLGEEHSPRSFLPIVAITGDTSPETRLRALLLGVQCFVSKPIDYLDTVLQIGNLLEVRHLVRQLQRECEFAQAM